MAGDDLAITTIGALLARDGGSVKTGPFGTTLKASEYSNEGVPLISVGEVGYGSLRVGDATPRAPREVVERLPEYVLEAGDIVFGRKGAVDRSAMVKPEQAGWFLGSDGIRLRLPSSCDARFIAYQLQSHEARSWLLQHATGTTMASLNQSTIERLPIVLPPLSEQRAISHILGTFDDKIELNRRKNETLEAMARAIFKSWFVDFDPVRAKAEGRDPGLPQPFVDLFPDSFEDSELGEIPRRWEVRTIGELSEQVAMGPFGSSIKVDTFVSDGIPVISGQHLRGTLLDDSKYNFITEEHADQLRRSNVRRGDVVFTHAGSIGQVAYVPDTCRYERYVISQRQFYMRCGSNMSPLFIVFYFKTAEGRHRLLANTSSTGVPSISQPVSYLRQLTVVTPPESLLKAFDSIARKFLGMIGTNGKESGSLATLRDSLLPKLISGKVRVKDSRRRMSTAVNESAFLE